MQPFHHFTVDVEEHFQVCALEPFVERRAWDRLPSRVVASTERLLDLLEAHDARGTFFMLGWIAKRCPSLVREIASRGHEIASHGMDHRRVTKSTPAEFRASVRESKDILEQLSGARVLGFRAPSFSIVPGVEWALDTLIEEGYVYDSSLFPIRRPDYGYPGIELQPHTIARAAGPLVEFPLATLVAFGKNLPAGGGGYFRLLPYRLVHAALAQASKKGYPTTFYIHPWEIDSEQPRFEVPLPTRIRHYGGLKRTLPRLTRLLRSFRFRRIMDSLHTSAVTPAVDAVIVLQETSS